MQTALKPSLRSGRQAFASPAVPPALARKVRTQAYVEPSVSFAVVQQAAAYVVVLGAEGIYTRTQLPEGSPGRPDIVPIAAGGAGVAVATALVASSSDFLNTPAFIIGILASGAMLAYCVKRTIDTVQDESDWPGPKVWPATMSLISFFCLNVFIQGLRAEL